MFSMNEIIMRFFWPFDSYHPSARSHNGINHSSMCWCDGNECFLCKVWLVQIRKTIFVHFWTWHRVEVCICIQGYSNIVQHDTSGSSMCKWHGNECFLLKVWPMYVIQIKKNVKKRHGYVSRRLEALVHVQIILHKTQVAQVRATEMGMNVFC